MRVSKVGLWDESRLTRKWSPRPAAAPAPPPRPRRTWSESQDSELRALWAAGTSVKEISHRVGHPEYGVRKRRALLELPVRHARGGRELFSLHVDSAVMAELRGRASRRRCSVASLVRRVLALHCGLG